MATLARKMKRRAEGKLVSKMSRRVMLSRVLMDMKMTRNQNLKENCEQMGTLHIF